MHTVQFCELQILAHIQRGKLIAVAIQMCKFRKELNTLQRKNSLRSHIDDRCSRKLCGAQRTVLICVEVFLDIGSERFVLEIRCVDGHISALCKGRNREQAQQQYKAEQHTQQSVRFLCCFHRIPPNHNFIPELANRLRTVLCFFAALPRGERSLCQCSLPQPNIAYFVF